MFQHIFETGIPPEALGTLFEECLKTMVSRRSEWKNLCGCLGNTCVSACLRNRNPSRSLGHIFFECDFALLLWQQVRGWLDSLDIELELNRTKLLFGVHSENSLSVKNFIILTVKYYIWKTKFQNTPLTLNDYQHYLKSKLEDQKNAWFLKGKEFKFEKWLIIFNCLETVCTDTNLALSPTTIGPTAQASATPPAPGTPTDHRLPPTTDQQQDRDPTHQLQVQDPTDQLQDQDLPDLPLVP